MDLLRRIERVFHEELNNFRRSIQCRNGVNGARCDTVHMEWFAVPEDVAIRTVKRWKRVLDYAPYGDSGLLNSFWSDRVKDGSYLRVGEQQKELDLERAHQRYQS